MRLSDYTRAAGSSVAHAVEEASAQDAAVTPQTKEKLRQLLYKDTSSQRLAQLASLEKEQAAREIGALIQQVMAAGDFRHLGPAQRQRLQDELVDMILGLGPLEALLADDSVTEIMVNGCGSIFFERDGFLHPAAERFDSEEQLRLVVDRVVSPLGRRVDEQQPIVNARLPQGHRVNVVIPPVSLEGTALTIRKFRPISYSLEELVQMGSMTAPMAQLLRWAVRSRKNIAVCGGTGGGKTTLLNALSREIPPDERIVTIEDAAELRFDAHPHVVRLEARMPNAEGKGAVTIRELVTNALRMRPDRIIVGECRSAEALDMLQAMCTGHDGSLTSLHAGCPQEAVSRLVMMVRYGMDLPAELIREQVFSAVDVFVQQDRSSNGQRRVTQIAVRSGGASPVGQGGEQAVPAQDGGEFPYCSAVRWCKQEGAYVWEHEPAWVGGLPLDEIATEEEVGEWRQQLQQA